MPLMRSIKAVPKPEPVPPEKERFMMIPSRVLHFYNCFVNFYIDSYIFKNHILKNIIFIRKTIYKKIYAKFDKIF